MLISHCVNCGAQIEALRASKRYCVPCFKQKRTDYRRAYRAANIEKSHAQERARYQRHAADPQWREAEKARRRKRWSENSEYRSRRTANIRVSQEKKRQLLLPKPCRGCGDPLVSRRFRYCDTCKQKEAARKKQPLPIPVSQNNNPRAYNRWYRRLKSGKPLEYWLEYDKKKEHKKQAAEHIIQSKAKWRSEKAERRRVYQREYKRNWRKRKDNSGETHQTGE